MKFIHLCYQLDCIEAVSLLAPVVVTLEDASTVSIKILLAADELYELVRQGSEDKKSKHCIYGMPINCYYGSLG